MLQYLKSTLAMRVMTYGYSNARAKSMKSLLMARKEFEQLADTQSVNDILGYLEKTSYKEDLVNASLNYSGLTLIEIALSRNYARVAKKLLSISPEDSLPALQGILGRWDVTNLKTILVAKHLGYTEESIKPFIVNVGNIPELLLNKLIQQQTVEAVINTLSINEFGIVLQKQLKEYKEKKEIMSLLQALDFQYFSRLPHLIKGHYKDDRTIMSMLKAEIDSKNISNILRGKRDNLDAKAIEKFIISGGNLAKGALKEMLNATNTEEVIEAVGSTYDLKESLERFRQDNSLIHFETAMEKNILVKGLSVLRRSILSIGSIVGYLYLKESEISNIRKIARAKDYNLPKEKLMDMIVLV